MDITVMHSRGQKNSSSDNESDDNNDKSRGGVKVKDEEQVKDEDYSDSYSHPSRRKRKHKSKSRKHGKKHRSSSEYGQNHSFSRRRSSTPERKENKHKSRSRRSSRMTSPGPSSVFDHNHRDDVAMMATGDDDDNSHVSRHGSSRHKHGVDESKCNESNCRSDGFQRKSSKSGERGRPDDGHSQPNSKSHSRQEICEDYNFDFTKYKYSLGKIFFRSRHFEKFTERGSQEYDDFWAFVGKFQDFQRKKAEKSKGTEKGQSTSKYAPKLSENLQLPLEYDVQYKINFSFVCKEFEEFLKKGRLVDFQTEPELTRQRVMQFRGIMLHYLDFQQRQKFQKLHKIRRDQRNLPIFQYKDKIIDMVKTNQVIVVAGDTGCGKSTQVPQYLMEAGFEKIACTQPRRIACISLSKRVGYETLNEYGSQVAYQVRFEKSKTAATKILFLTEGLLLRQLVSDPLLEMYSVIVIDEVHERHIFTDFLMGVLKCVLRQRADLKLVLMSATININLFSGYFYNAHVIKVPGRLYPIQLEYFPTKTESSMDSRRHDPSPYLKIMQKIDHKYPSTERGDLLIFLSGMSEISAVADAARTYGQQNKRWIVLCLHSSLSVEEQDKVFDIAPEGVRKCIVSTNIAETSVTIDGVRFIADSGKVKEMSYDPKYKMRKLEEFWISRASSEQRKGRAGRTGPGVCFRLYEESEYDSFQDYATPEILRVPLDSLILQMISMGLPDARKFPFIEAPSMSSIENSIVFLKEQGALTSDEQLTSIGQMLSMLPVDVVIGKMLIMGSIFNMIDPILSITAAMSVQSPFTNRAFTDPEATTARKTLESDHGDPFTLLNAFDEWIEVKSKGQSTRGWSKRRGLEEQRFYEMTKLKRQFKQLLQDHHLLDSVDDRQRYLTSAERMMKHGERKRLQQLRKEKMREKRGKKFLKLEDEEYRISDDNDDEKGDRGDDIKDLEFRLSNDLNKLQETSNRSRNFTLRDINLIKIILCSGLYPQVAIADECNSYKRDSEQAFHTKSKPFLLLNPTGTFAGQPDLLMPKDSSGKRPAPADMKGLLSSTHELLAYVSLLETNNKPYLVTTMRVPALQTVTLFSNCMDTNRNCTRILCDEWLEIKFPSEDSAETVVSSIVQLRSTWNSLLKTRLEDTFEGIEEERRVSPRARQLERLLASKLTEFLHSDILYSIRRVLPAEIHKAYVGPGKGRNSSLFSKLSKGDNPNVEHPVKGGIRVTDYLTINCLLDDESASVWGDYTSTMQRHWVCPSCQQSLVVSVLERLQHEASCGTDGTEGLKRFEAEEDEKEKQASLNPLRKSYFCEICQETLSLTNTEILKHKRTHAS